MLKLGSRLALSLAASPQRATCHTRLTSFDCSAKVQMVLVYNVNFGPWLNASNLGHKREALQDYMQLHACPPEDRICNLGTGQQHLRATHHHLLWPFHHCLFNQSQHVVIRCVSSLG